jgi:CheY-like chemotaxis protein
MALAPGPEAPPLVVIVHHDPATADGLRHAVEAVGWRAAVAQPGPAGLAAVFATRPAVALVGCALLDELPPGLDVPLLAVGDDTSSADQRAARDAGARSLVTWPDGVADLAVELAKAATGEAAVGEARSPVVAVRGVQGGAARPPSPPTWRAHGHDGVRPRCSSPTSPAGWLSASTWWPARGPGPTWRRSPPTSTAGRSPTPSPSSGPT